MEFIPICLDCKNFKKKDYCQYFSPIPFAIKNRERKCPYFTGGDYVLYTKESKPKKKNKGKTK